VRAGFERDEPDKRLRSVASAPRYLPSVSLTSVTVGHGRAEHGEELFAGGGLQHQGEREAEDRPGQIHRCEAKPGHRSPVFPPLKKSSMSLLDDIDDFVERSGRAFAVSEDE